MESPPLAKRIVVIRASAYDLTCDGSTGLPTPPPHGTEQRHAAAEQREAAGLGDGDEGDGVATIGIVVERVKAAGTDLELRRETRVGRVIIIDHLPADGEEEAIPTAIVENRDAEEGE